MRFTAVRLLPARLALLFLLVSTVAGSTSSSGASAPAVSSPPTRSTSGLARWSQTRRGAATTV